MNYCGLLVVYLHLVIESPTYPDNSVAKGFWISALN